MKVCNCGHTEFLHRHYSRSTACAYAAPSQFDAELLLCSCESFRRSKRWHRLLRTASRVH